MFCFFTCKVILQCKSFNFITREIFLALHYSGVFSQKGWRTRDPSSLPEQGRVSQARVLESRAARQSSVRLLWVLRGCQAVKWSEAPSSRRGWTPRNSPPATTPSVSGAQGPARIWRRRRGGRQRRPGGRCGCSSPAGRPAPPQSLSRSDCLDMVSFTTRNGLI